MNSNRVNILSFLIASIITRNRLARAAIAAAGPAGPFAIASYTHTMPIVLIKLPASPTQKSLWVNTSKLQKMIPAIKTMIFTTKIELYDTVLALNPLFTRFLVSIPFAVKHVGVITPNNTGTTAGTV